MVILAHKQVMHAHKMLGWHRVLPNTVADVSVSTLTALQILRVGLAVLTFKTQQQLLLLARLDTSAPFCREAYRVPRHKRIHRMPVSAKALGLLAIMLIVA